MLQKELQIKYLEFDSKNELAEEDKQLIDKAVEALQTSYAPYSQFKVGAAIKLSSGKIIIGSNQENSASPLCLCAERVAIFAAKVAYPDEVIEKIAITAFSENFDIEEPVVPCGSCRQTMVETVNRQNGKPFEIILHSPNDKVIIFQSINDLLPLSFDEERLKNE